MVRMRQLCPLHGAGHLIGINKCWLLSFPQTTIQIEIFIIYKGQLHQEIWSSLKLTEG